MHNLSDSKMWNNMLNHAIGPSMAAQASKNGKEYNKKKEVQKDKFKP